MLKVVVTFAFYFHFKLFDIFLLENILFIFLLICVELYKYIPNILL